VLSKVEYGEYLELCRFIQQACFLLQCTPRDISKRIREIKGEIEDMKVQITELTKDKKS